MHPFSQIIQPCNVLRTAPRGFMPIRRQEPARRLAVPGFTSILRKKIAQRPAVTSFMLILILKSVSRLVDLSGMKNPKLNNAKKLAARGYSLTLPPESAHAPAMLGCLLMIRLKNASVYVNLKSIMIPRPKDALKPAVLDFSPIQ